MLPSYTPPVASRLPRVGTTIFTVMSALAQQHGAVNLGQGFPDFDCDPRLIDAVERAMRAGHNQYPPMAGVAALREAVAAKVATLYGHAYDPGSEVTITAGATQAILSAILALVHPGDEVIVLEPCYDSYGPNIELAGGRIVRVPLTPGSFRPDFERIAAAIGPRTRLVIVNTPHNPSATVWSEADMKRLAELLRPTDVLLLADEVYQLLHHGKPPPHSLGSMADQGNVISLGTFSKILAPGLRLGWIQTNPALMQRLLATGALVSGGNFNHFTSHVVRQLLEDGRLASFVADLRTKYAARAEAMDAALRKHLDGVVRWQKPEGGYFFWLTLAEGLKAADYLEAARSAGTGFLAGPGCSATAGLSNCLRLSFAHYTVPDIHEGIARLGRALRP